MLDFLFLLQDDSKSTSPIDLFKTPGIRLATLNLLFAWYVCIRVIVDQLLSVYIGGSGGGACQAHSTPYGTQFFRFRIHFHQKVPASEVHTPPNGCMSPYGKSCICHWSMLKPTVADLEICPVRWGVMTGESYGPRVAAIFFLLVLTGVRGQASGVLY